jgi:hypothetical protein
MPTLTRAQLTLVTILTLLTAGMLPPDARAQSAPDPYQSGQDAIEAGQNGDYVGAVKAGLETASGIASVVPGGDDVADLADAAGLYVEFAQQIIGDSSALADLLTGSIQTYEANGFELTVNNAINGDSITVTLYDNRAGGGVVTIPDAVTGIETLPLPVVGIFNLGAAANISILNLGANVQFINAHALDVASLTDIESPNNPNFSSLNGVLFNSDQTVLLRYPEALGGSYVIPRTVTNIADNAFCNCSNLTSLVIGTNVVVIGTNAFGNSRIPAVYFAGNAPYNNGTAFNGASGAVYYLPRTTGWGAQYGGIPATLYNPFSYAPGNSAYTITGMNPWNDPASAAQIIPSTINGLPVTAIAANAFYLNPYLTNVIVPDGITNIGQEAFALCPNLQSIQLGANLASLGDSAFYGCPSLRTLSLPNGVTAIPDGLVAGCTNLQGFTLGTNVTGIGYGAFDNCPALYYLFIPATVNSIGAEAFDYCSSVRISVDPLNQFYASDAWGSLFNKTRTELVHAKVSPSGSYSVPDSVVNIDDYAFYGESLSTVYLPSGVSSLGAAVFADCPNLAAAYFAGSAPSTNDDGAVFGGDTNIVYVLTGGWGATYGGARVMPWVPYVEVTSNNSITLVSYQGPGGNVVLLGTINGLPVTAIQAGVFSTPGAVTSLTLPDGVTNIVDGAFSGLVNLTNIVFGKGLTSIGNNAFSGCTSLQNLVIPNSVRSIGIGAFSHCGITNLVIGSGLTSLSDGLFSYCSLTALTIPMTVSHIGAGTFANNPLQSIIVPNSVISLGANAFANCPYLVNAYFQGNAPANDGTAFSGDNLNDYYSPGGLYDNTVVQYLPGATGWGASYGGAPAQVLPIAYATNNNTITITRFYGTGGFAFFSTINGVPITGIGDNAFANCQGLFSVVIPAGILKIGASPFLNCTNLTSLVVAAGNPNYQSVNNVLYNSSRTLLLQYPAGLGSTYQVPATVTDIGAGSFYGSAVQQVAMPASVSAIGSEAFAFAHALTNLSVATGNPGYSSAGGVLFNASQTTLVQYPGGRRGGYAVPGSVTNIGPAAFSGPGVTSVVLANSISMIASGALAYCPHLTNITVVPGNANFASVNGVLEDITQTTLLQFPGGLNGAFTLGTNLSAIGDLAFAGSSLGHVTVPATVTSVGSDAFAGCPDLFEVNFFGNAPANDGTAFTNDEATVYWVASASGWGAQYGGARTYEVPFDFTDNGNNTVTLTGYAGSSSTGYIPTDIFGETVTAIGSEAFAFQTNLSVLDIPSTVTSIGESAFEGCTRLTTLVLRNSGYLSVADDAFGGCHQLTSVSFGPGPAAIGDYGFYDCTSLNFIDFGGVTNIGNHAFDGCSALNYVNIGYHVLSIGSYAFVNCALTEISLPPSVQTLGSDAFAGCGSAAGDCNVYANGNPPASDGTAFANGHAQIIYTPGFNWGSTYDGVQTLEIPAGFYYTVDASGATITGLQFGYADLIIPPTLFSPLDDTPVPVVAIAANAFAGNLNITNVEFPDSLLNIHDGAFLDCSNLLSASLPASLTSIGNSAFQNCVRLGGVNLSGNVTNIGSYAFAGCPGGTNLEFGAGLAYLGTNAFAGWTNLQTVDFSGNALPGNDSPFAGDANAVIYVLPGSSGWGANYFGNTVSQWVQYLYSTNNDGTLALQFYLGSQNGVTVPSVINGHVVTILDGTTFANNQNITSIILPNTITNIDAYAFSDCSALTNLILGTNLVAIGPDAFYECGLQNVVLPDSLTNLPDQLFYLSAISNVVFPGNLLSIGDNAFQYCPLGRVALPNSVQSIGNEAFADTGLTNIVLPASLLTIGDRAFWHCPIAGSILMPPGVTSLGDSAFFGNGGLGAVYFQGNAPSSDGTPIVNAYTTAIINGIAYNVGPGIAYYVPSTYGWGTTYSGLPTATWNPYAYTITGTNVTITGYTGTGGALSVPGTIGGYPVTGIGANAFASNASLTQVTLPSSIISVGTGAFAGSTNLVAIYFNGNAPVAGSNLFAGDQLRVFYLNSTTGWSTNLGGTTVTGYAATGEITLTINPGNIGARWQVDGGAFLSSGSTATNLLPGPHVVSFSTVGGSWLTPGNLTLYVDAFNETPFTIAYQSIPFSYVTNGNGTLTITGYSGGGGTVYIPATINGVTVTAIAAGAFASSAISGIIMPDTITQVGTNAFAGCARLVSVTVSSGITNLSGNVFQNCPDLLSVFFDGNAPATDGTIFASDAITSVYHLSNATGWTNTYGGKSDSVIPYAFSVGASNTISITGYAGAGGNVTIPGQIGGLPVTDIYASVFLNNLSLTNVTIPDSVVSIDYQAFRGCSNLQTVIFGTNVQSIGFGAFYDCTSLTGLSFPDRLQVIYQDAFAYDGNLASVNLGNGLNTIYDSVFQSCTNLSQLSFGNGLTNIGPGAFAQCSALTNLTFPNGLTTIQSGAFIGCTSLTNLDFGTNLAVIGDDSFNGCIRLTNLDFPPNIYLGTNAFAFCSGLQSVFFGGNMQFISGPAFDSTYTADSFYDDRSAVVYYPSAAAANDNWRTPNFAQSDYQAAIAYSFASPGTVTIDHIAANTSAYVIPDTLGGFPVTRLADNAIGADFIGTLTIGSGLVSLGTQGDTNLFVNNYVVNSANPNYNSIGGVLFDKAQTTLIRFPNSLNSFGSYTVPATVTNIADYAFQDCQVASVNLSTNLASIGNAAFSGDVHLARVYHPAPDQLTSLGQSAFAGCSALTNFVTGNNLSVLQPWAFANCTGLQTFTLGSTVGAIGTGAFSNCVSLAAIIFPPTLGSIGDGAFANCQSLSTLTIPAGHPAGTNYYSIQLGSGVFAGCGALQSAYFLGNRPNPDYGNTFAGDNQLTVYYLTNSLGWSTTFDGITGAAYAPFGALQVSTSPYGLGAWQVDGGPFLTSGSTVTNLPVGNHTISFAPITPYYTPANQLVVVSNLSLTTASATYVQTPVAYTVNSTNSITITGDYHLNADGFLVVPPAINGVPVTSIAAGAFANNRSLVGVILPSTVTNIGSGSFQSCPQLSMVILDTNLLSIGDSAFFGCAGLQSVIIPDSVTNLGQGVFADCQNLSIAQIGAGITQIAFNYLFSSDPALSALFFDGPPPADAGILTNIYPQLMNSYPAAIYYNPAAPGWDGVADGNPTDWTTLFTYFTNNSGGLTLTSVQNDNYYNSLILIPPSISGLPVTDIGSGAFQDAPGVVALPPSVTTLEASAFYQGSAPQVFIGASVTNIGYIAFGNSSQLQNIFVDPANPNYSDIQGILYDKAQTELIAAGGSRGYNNPGAAQVTVPNGVSQIDDYALYNLNYLSGINLPASLAVIGEEALSGDYNLTNITVDPANAAFSTGDGALLNKSATLLIQYFGHQSSYPIPSGVQAIGDGAFYNAYSLQGVLIPSSVVNIGRDAFNDCGIGSLLIPNTVTNIGPAAFFNEPVTNIVLPSGLTAISSNLCGSCRALTAITIPAGVTDLGDDAFAYSGLTQITLPPGLKHLGQGVFQFTPLMNLIVPDNVTEIGDFDFTYCYDLTNATFGASVTNIGVSAFEYDYALRTVNFDDGLVGISSNAFHRCGINQELIFPASLAALGVNAFFDVNPGEIYFLGNAPATNGPVFNDNQTFYYNSGASGWGAGFSGFGATDYDSEFSYATNADGTLTIVGCALEGGEDLVLPSQENGILVTGLASYALQGQEVINVSIPAGITNLAPDAFAGVSAANFIVDAANPACTNVAGSLYDLGMTRLLAPANLPAFDLPATVTNLLASTFDGCYVLTNISVAAANPSFSGVNGVLFDKNQAVLLRYPPGAVAGSYAVPPSVTTIGTNAFEFSSLSAIEVPPAVTNIQSQALAYSNLRGAYFAGPAPVFDPTAFAHNRNLILFYLSPTNAGGYASAGVPNQPWLSLFNWVTNNGNSIAIVGYNDPGNQNYVLFPKAGIGRLPITDVGTAFAEAGLTGIVLPAGITNIAVGAFSDCGLEEVVLPANLSCIGSNAFVGCRLTTVNIPPRVEYIGDWAFLGGNGDGGNDFTTVVIPAGVKILGNGVFEGNQLSQVFLTNGLLSIGDTAFADNQLPQIYLPNSITNLGVAAFAGNQLSAVSLPVGLLNIPDYAFDDNEGLQTLVIPAGVTNIGAYAFYRCNISSLTIPDSVVSIGGSAFAGGSLSSLTIPASVTSIGDSAFAGNSINAAYFLGNAPANDDGTALADNNITSAYYLPGTTGWGSTYGGVTMIMLSPQVTTANNGDNTLTITNYSGWGAVVVPTVVNGRPVTVIGSGAFTQTGSPITSITLPNGITQIASGAFGGLAALTTIVIPATVTNIDIDAFAGCPGLTNIVVDPNNPFYSVTNGVLFDKNQTTLLACGGGVAGTYVIPDTVTAIGTDAFMGCSALTNVVFPNGLTSIGDPAFADCDNLTTLTIPATVNFLGDYCFAFCPSLTSIIFEGDAPPDDGTVFEGDVNATVYYKPSAVGFGPTFGTAPTAALANPVATPITIYRLPGGAAEISIASLAGQWTDPNNAYPVTFGGAATASTNQSPVVAGSGTILYPASTNSVNDQILYRMVDSQGLVGYGVINVAVVPISNLSMTLSQGAPTISFSGVAYQSYSILVSTNFLNWNVVWTGTNSINGPLQYTVTNALLPVAFYRLQSNP